MSKKIFSLLIIVAIIVLVVKFIGETPHWVGNWVLSIAGILFFVLIRESDKKNIDENNKKKD